MPINQAQVAEIFQFLKANHSWNDSFQKSEHQAAIGHCRSSNARLVKLLSSISNTQSAPNLTELAPFWRHIHTYTGNTLESLIKHLELTHYPRIRAAGPWEGLFYALEAQPGWGSKTAALFVKTAIQIHRGPENLHFWTDGARLANGPIHENIYLPVDAVIIRIFDALDFERRTTFQNINRYLHETYSAEDMLIWDDLWYWGFFTQIVQNGVRNFAWNSDKFWCQASAPKAQEHLVHELGIQFIELLTRDH